MDYIKTYKSFINSHYLTEGLKITSGVLLPAFIMSYFGMLTTGIVLSLGGLFVSITDSPGPAHHRRNGMVSGIASILAVTLFTGLFSSSVFILTIFIAAACFFFSMIGIYGARASSVGTAALIVLTLTLDPRLDLTTPVKVMQHSLLMASGGLWYLCYSMLLYNFRPYRLARQALGDYIEATAEYLRIRSELYSKEIDYEGTFLQLLQQQSAVQHKQSELTELLFKTRSIVKESTHAGRTLVMIHLETADIFERIMMSHQEYQQLHNFFDEADILNDYYALGKKLAEDLYEIGIAVKSGERFEVNEHITDQVAKTKEKLEAFRLSNLTPENIDGFISLRRILENIQDLSDHLSALHSYTGTDNTREKKERNNAEFETMITHQRITPAMFVNNLTLQSDIFRHSLRASIAVLAGFLASLFFNFGHSYWILLTIVVILKPAFSLTKKRNTDRLGGTFAGILVGVVILLLIHNTAVLLVLMILFMAGTYSFMRTNYFIMVLLMTPYLVLFYHLLHPQDFTLLLKDRVIDTLIGCAIAVAASGFLFPAWEREKIKPLMIEMVTELKNYFSVIADGFGISGIAAAALQTTRKNALVALANLSEAFNRMLSEPKSQQKGIEKLHQFVVLSHSITSYISTLSWYIQSQKNTYPPEEFIYAAEDIKKYLHETVEHLHEQTESANQMIQKESLRKLNERADELLTKRKQELKQGLMETETRKSLFDLKSIVNQLNLIYNAAVDINKISKTLKMDQ